MAPLFEVMHLEGLLYKIETGKLLKVGASNFDDTSILIAEALALKARASGGY